MTPWDWPENLSCWSWSSSPCAALLWPPGILPAPGRTLLTLLKTKTTATSHASTVTSTMSFLGHYLNLGTSFLLADRGDRKGFHGQGSRPGNHSCLPWMAPIPSQGQRLRVGRTAGRDPRFNLAETKDPSTEVGAAPCPHPPIPVTGFVAHKAGLGEDRHLPLRQSSTIFQG